MAGVEPATGRIRVEIAREADVYEARFQARQLARRMGFDAYDQAAIETAVAELATNIYRHAGRGTMLLAAHPRAGKPVALDVAATNPMPESPGVTGHGGTRHEVGPPREGLGIGLAGVRRLMDEVRIAYAEGLLHITARKWLPRFRPPPAVESVGLIETSPRYRAEAASRPWRPGLCADSYLVKEQDGRLAVLVADVLGHSQEAAEVAHILREAAGRLMEPVSDVRPDDVLMRLHAILRGTRGACAVVATVEPDGRRLVWAGVGNVRARVWHARAPAGAGLVPVPGIVGYNLRRVGASEVHVTPPACLAVVTDGLEEAALDRQPLDAETLVRRFASGRDDATAVVVRW